MKQTAAAIFFILALLRSAQADDPAILGQGNGLADFVVSVCGPAPQSDLCYEAESILRARVIKSLLELGASRSRERAYATVLSYVDHPEPDIRAAALAALGGLHPDAQDTALLADALNDPIPAIRSAALSSLVQSSDPATNALVDRARDDQGMSLEADPPPDRGLLGVSLPPSAEPLRFTDDVPEGVVAFVTNQSAQEILDFYSALTGQSALPLAAARQLLLPAWAATSGMAFYQELGKRMEEFGALPQEQQLSAQYRLALIMALSQEGQLPAEFDRWQDEERWGDVRVMALALDPLLEMPSQLLLVYQDRDLQRTGFALQWLPALDFPAALVPQSRPAETPIASAEDLDHAALEQTIWEAVALRGTAATYGAYLKALPQGAHVSEAQAALDSLGKVSTPMSPAPQVAAVPEPAALSIEGSPHQMETLVINYVGMPEQRTPWVTVVPAQLPDDQWSDWAYANPGSGKVTLPGQPAGNYEIRALLENPREVIARLPVTILPSEAGPPNLSLLSEPRAQEPIVVHFSNLPGDKGDWISVVPARQPDTEWGAWVYTGGISEGDVTLPGQPAGDYELRAYTEKPQREVLVRLRLNILP